MLIRRQQVRRTKESQRARASYCDAADRLRAAAMSDSQAEYSSERVHQFADSVRCG